jgi:glycosyltransferase involved in cell wall biosynthesis
MLLTIAIPTYNRPEELLGVVRTLFHQIAASKLEKFIEILICDNSTLPNLRLTDEFHGNWVRYVHNGQNIGQGKNINKLFENAKGEYVWILADDDQLAPEAVYTIFNHLTKIDEKGLDVDFLTFYTGDKKSKNLWIQNTETSNAIDSSDFLKMSWEHPIFISNNVLKSKAARSLIESWDLNSKINDTYQNSVLSFGVILSSKQVYVIPETLVFDGWRDKFYAPIQGFRVKITDLMKLEKFLKFFDNSNSFVSLLHIEILSKTVFWSFVYSGLGKECGYKLVKVSRLPGLEISLLHKCYLLTSVALQNRIIYSFLFHCLKIFKGSLATSIEVEIQNYQTAARKNPTQQTYDSSTQD